MKKKRSSKTTAPTNRWLNFALTAALSTFFVLASAEAIDFVTGDNKGTGQMSAFERGQYHFNHSGNAAAYDLAEARHAYAEVLQDQEANGAEIQTAWYQLGRIDFLEGKFDSAIWRFDHLVEEYNDPIPNVHYMLGLTHGYKAKFTGLEKEWVAAEEEFKKFLARVPESPWGRTDLAWVYFAQSKYEEMLPVLEAGLQLQPENPWLLNMYGLALLNIKDVDAARLAFEQAEASIGELSIEAWGSAYPGNDPRVWAAGLESFREVIAKNKELAAAAIESE